MQCGAAQAGWNRNEPGVANFRLLGLPAGSTGGFAIRRAGDGALLTLVDLAVAA